MKQLLLAAIKCKVNSNYGFSLLEALVGILVITTFTLAALQAMVLATVFRVKAEQESGATNWIQEQVEQVKFEAFDLPSNDDLCDASSASEGYGQELKDVLEGSGSVTVGSFTGEKVNDRPEDKYPGEEIWLLRNATPKDEAPYQVLKLEYVAVLDDGGNPSTDPDDIVAELYTEVIPDEAFACN